MERIETNGRIKRIDLLAALHRGDHSIGERRDHGFERDFEEPLRPDECDDFCSGKDAAECEGDEDERIEPFPGDRGSDGAEPQMLAAGLHFELRKDRGVTEGTAEIGDEGSAEQTGRGTEDQGVRILTGKERRGRNHFPYRDRNNGEEIAEKSRPDDSAHRGVSVDLRDDVADDVTQGKDDDADREKDPEEIADLHGDDVAHDERRDEDAGKQVLKRRYAHGKSVAEKKIANCRLQTSAICNLQFGLSIVIRFLHSIRFSFFL